ncbi:hypothetical protein TIFTF001_052029 [Ficus carica]|uniref:Uncharacterized protein n=1 Tax=Ficus carica TaxID=3494 RepID=A0AA88EG52_FICCA|nr:hypothetical protein TIFTF001_052023 [Ficus carica]GMN72526.1 hypothetical protein TIFTF001_052025 [Ficus carica]GMN72531.1 hypothetical protein TIFTF001_052027 [Ficus carica]GMN72535.1 hypothetical protein TIFTF001_052029 [Ficus carica]
MAKTQGGQLDRCLALGLSSATANMLGGRNSVTMKAGVRSLNQVGFTVQRFNGAPVWTDAPNGLSSS